MGSLQGWEEGMGGGGERGEQSIVLRQIWKADLQDSGVGDTGKQQGARNGDVSVGWSSQGAAAEPGVDGRIWNWFTLWTNYTLYLVFLLFCHINKNTFQPPVSVNFTLLGSLSPHWMRNELYSDHETVKLFCGEGGAAPFYSCNPREHTVEIFHLKPCPNWVNL